MRRCAGERTCSDGARDSNEGCRREACEQQRRIRIRMDPRCLPTKYGCIALSRKCIPIPQMCTLIPQMHTLIPQMHALTPQMRTLTPQMHTPLRAACAVSATHGRAGECGAGAYVRCAERREQHAEQIQQHHLHGMPARPAPNADATSAAGLGAPAPAPAPRLRAHLLRLDRRRDGERGAHGHREPQHRAERQRVPARTPRR